MYIVVFVEHGCNKIWTQFSEDNVLVTLVISMYYVISEIIIYFLLCIMIFVYVGGEFK